VRAEDTLARDDALESLMKCKDMAVGVTMTFGGCSASDIEDPGPRKSGVDRSVALVVVRASGGIYPGSPGFNPWSEHFLVQQNLGSTKT
jgi:hypothetical protein